MYLCNKAYLFVTAFKRLYWSLIVRLASSSLKRKHVKIYIYWMYLQIKARTKCTLKIRDHIRNTWISFIYSIIIKLILIIYLKLNNLLFFFVIIKYILWLNTVKIKKYLYPAGYSLTPLIYNYNMLNMLVSFYKKR